MSSAPHLDLDALTTLKEVMEDEFQLLLDTFVTDSTGRLTGLRDALAQQDAEEVRRTAHSLKGSCSNIGAPLMAELCHTLEEGGRNQQLDGLEGCLEQVEAEFLEVKAGLAAL